MLQALTFYQDAAEHSLSEKMKRTRNRTFLNEKLRLMKLSGW